MPDNKRSINLDTLGAISAHHHRLSGSCLDCSALHRLDRGDNLPAFFDIDLNALIAKRGVAAPTSRMAPVPCPRCGSQRTKYRIGAPWKN